MSNVFRFFVPGKPIGKGRPRFNRDTGCVYTPKETKEYEELVRLCFLAENHDSTPLSGPVSMCITAYFPIPKSTGKAERGKMMSEEVLPTKKPDCDNILKAIADALNSLAYEDDRQVTGVLMEKKYSEEPGVRVVIFGHGEEEWDNIINS